MVILGDFLDNEKRANTQATASLESWFLLWKLYIREEAAIVLVGMHEGRVVFRQLAYGSPFGDVELSYWIIDTVILIVDIYLNFL
jgi:hypothetical protein